MVTSRLVGTQRAKEIIFDNEVWNGETAFHYGAVDELIESEGLLECAIKKGREMG